MFELQFQYQSQIYANQLLAKGYRKTKEHEQADVSIFNTYTVTDAADISTQIVSVLLLEHSLEAFIGEFI